MVDRPILFSGAMVRALLEGRKTQTRRVLKPAPFIDAMGNFCAMDRKGKLWNYGQRVDGKPCLDHYTEKCVRFCKGDRLWVKETWRTEARHDAVKPTEMPRDALVSLDADYLQEPNDGCRGRTRVSIHMPRWASRLTLTVTDVRVQRLQEISDEDAEAEGCPECSQCHGVGWINSGPDGGWQCPKKGCGYAYVDQYARLWDEINGAGSWAANPWVVAVTFTVERRNIDALPTDGAAPDKAKVRTP